MPPYILVVDDDEVNLVLVKRILELSGYTVATARSGQVAIQQVIQRMPDLAIMDVIMPDMDGYTLCRRLRQHPINAQIPIVMLTAGSDENDRAQALEAGANELWSKPFEMDVMQARLEALLHPS